MLKWVVARKKTIQVLFYSLTPACIAFLIMFTIGPSLYLRSPWFLFFPAVFVSAWLGGGGAGIGAVLLSTILVYIHFLPPAQALVKDDPVSYLMVGGFIAIGSAISIYQEYTRRALRRAQLNERRLNQAQRLSLIGSWELDLVKNVLVWSDEIFRLFEVDPEKFSASYETFLSTIHPDDRLLVDNAYRQSVINRTPYSIEHRLLFPDGRIKWVREEGETHYDGDKAVRSLGTVQDITDRKLAEERLRSAYEQVEIFFENASDSIFIIDGSGRLTSANKTAAALLGYSKEEFNAKTLNSLVSADERESVAETLRQILTVGVVSVKEWKFQHKNGHFIPVEVSAKFLRDDVGLAIARDIRDRKAAEKALKDAEQKFRGLIEAAQDAVVVINGQTGLINYANHQACLWFGYTPEELFNQSVDILVPERVRAKHMDYRMSFLSNPTKRRLGGHNVTLFGKRKDGSEFPVDIALSPSVTSEGIMVTAAIRDISEMRAAQERLRDSEERLALSLRGADLGTWDWNMKTNEVVFNQRWAEMRGYSVNEFKPHVQSWTLGVHPDDLSHMRQALNDYLAGLAEDYESEYRVFTKSGQFIWVLDRGKVFARDELGQPSRMVGVTIDITERKRTEDHQRFLADAGALLASSLESKDILKRISELTVRDWADFCFIDLLGAADDVALMDVSACHPSKGAAGERLMRVSIDRNRPHLSYTTLTSQKSVLLRKVDHAMLALVSQSAEHFEALKAMEPKSMMTVPLMAQDRLLGSMVLVSSSENRLYSDVDLRLAEELAQRLAMVIENSRLYQAAQAAIRTREDVMAIVSHDLKSPVASMAILGQRLRRSDPVSIEKLPELADQLQRYVKQMQFLIDDLLDFERIQSGTFTVERDNENLGEIISSFVDVVSAQAQAKQQILQMELPSEMPAVFCDARRINQVISNLLGNATKFTPAGGTIRLAVQIKERHVQVTVSDSGPGIAPEHHAKIFDRFWQATDARHKGSGLGLAIAKGIIEAHGGRIWVDSQLGQGSTFHFTIPLSSQPIHQGASSGRAPLTPVRPPARALRDVHVLVVDDAPEMLDIIRKVLEEAEATVTVAGSVREALGAMKRSRPDVLLTDIEMPEEDGVRLLELVRKLSPDEGGLIPIAAITALSRREDLLRLDAAGFDVTLSKPIDVETTVSAMRDLAAKGGRAHDRGGLVSATRGKHRH